MTKRNLFIFSGILLLGVFGLVAVSSSGLDLQGRLRGTESSQKLSCANMPTNTVYVSSSGTIKGDGSLANPYKTLSAVQNRLESESGIQAVCLGGELSGSLNLNAALSTSLTIAGSTGGASLGSSSSSTNVISVSAGKLKALSLQNLSLKDGMSLSNLDSIELSGNTFMVENGTALSITSSDSVKVEKNTFTSGSSTAIYLSQVPSATVLNNFILGQTGKAIHSYQSDLKLYYNSFYNNKYAVYLDGTADLKNNIFYAMDGQYALYYEAINETGTSVAQVDLSSDYNLFYSSTTELAYVETTETISADGENSGSAGYVDVLDLDSLKELGLEAHSVEGDPKFTNPSSNDLHILTGSLAQNAAQPILSVSTDFDGDKRNNVTRSGSASKLDIGADEIL